MGSSGARATFPAEASADLKISHAGVSSTRSFGNSTLHHTLLSLGFRLGAKTVLCPVSTVASHDTFSSSSSVTHTGERTDSTSSSSTSEVISLAMNWNG